MRATAVFNRLGTGMWPETAVLRGSGTHYFAEAPAGAASLKSVVAGTAAWTAHGRRFVLRDRMHLMLNAGEYMVEIDSPRAETTTLCIFFEPGFLEDVAEAHGLEWTESIQPWDARLWPLLDRFDATAPSEERIVAIAETLVAQRGDVRVAASSLRAVRASTRAEVAARVLRGRDFLLSSLAEPVTMKDAAREAAMSPYHFHRAFRDAFGAPPHRYLAARRLERAAHLLRTTGLSVTEVALDSGFASVPSFTSAFRRKYGVPPGVYR